MKRNSACLAAALACVGAMPVAAAPAEQSRPRLIVLTDIGNEPDDSESMVRLLTYANEIDVEGIAAATSRHRPADPRRDLIDERVAAYGKVLANLRRHDARYPDAERLRRVVVTGSPIYGMSGVGDGRDTAASRLIVAAVDRPDPRPVWVAVWGGAADLAQALWTVRASRPPEAVERFVAKLRVYSISDQDNAGPWARANFPKLFWIASIHGVVRYNLATWMGISAPLAGTDMSHVSKEWLSANIRSKGPLGALYPPPAYIMEGDTPSFLNLVPNGLSVVERPDWGGWGGRYDKLADEFGLWTTTSDLATGVDGKPQSNPQATIWRWRTAFQNDFAARMAWSVTPSYRNANHPPQPTLNGRAGTAPVEIAACPGRPVALTAAATDPDGNRLTHRWWVYREASGLFSPTATLSSQTGERTTVTIGGEANVDQFAPPRSYPVHVVLETTDDGTPALTRYRRAIITVPGGRAGETVDCAVRPIPPSH